MKKMFISICLVMASMCAFAQKSYISVSCLHKEASNDMYTIFLSGDIPGGMNIKNEYASIGKILSQLSSYGYNVEFMSATSTSNTNTIYLLSKNSGSSHTRMETVSYDDEEVKEVARYNLQGMPISKYEKGIQIVVYSNFTTKTIIVE